MRKENHKLFLNWIKKNNARVAVSLSSGGAEAMGRDLALMEMLTELNFPIDEIHGCSAGAPVAATYAFYHPTSHEDYDVTKRELSMKQMCKSYLHVMRFSNIFEFSFGSIKNIIKTRTAKSLTGLFKGDKLEKDIAHYLPGTFSDCHKELFIYAEKESDMNYEVFNKEKYPHMPLHEAIRASISMPHFFEPKEFKGKNYIDGGMLINTPLLAIYENYKNTIDDAKRPLVIFACTALYPYEEVTPQKNLWTVMKDRYFYKLMSRIFFLELNDMLEKKNVFIFLFHPQIEKIKGLAFQKVDNYRMKNKPNFYNLYHDYLKKIQYKKFSKALFKHKY